jgi:uncharacterized protein YebE (UPF0316 family)
VTHVCRVVKWFTLQGLKLPFSSNSTFKMLYFYDEMEADYLLVNEMDNISKLFAYTCMFSIGCKSMMLTT